DGRAVGPIVLVGCAHALAAAAVAHEPDALEIDAAAEERPEGRRAARLVPCDPAAQVLLHQATPFGDTVIAAVDGVGVDRGDDVPPAGELLRDVVVAAVVRRLHRARGANGRVGGAVVEAARATDAMVSV